jgi:hypothetical protein
MKSITAYIYIGGDNFKTGFLNRIPSKFNHPLVPLNVCMKCVYEFYGVEKRAPD